MINDMRYATTTNDTDDSGDFQKVQMESLGKNSTAFIMWPYGFGGNAPNGSFAVLCPIMGQEDMHAAFVSDPKNRIKGLEPSEVFMQNPVSGSSVIMKKNGDIEIVCKNDKKLTIAKDFNITVSGDVNINVAGSVNINAAGGVNLGAGGGGLARSGDSVEVTTDTGTWPGTITGGSTNNKAN